MRGLNATIRRRLISTAIGITIILIILGFVINFHLKNTFRQYQLLSKIDGLNTNELALRKYEKDFLLRETKNSEFYKTSKSAILDSFAITLDKAEQELKYLKQSGELSEFSIYQKFSLVETGFKDYRKNFELLKKEIVAKGFKDYGLEGQMRDQIHAVETIVEKQQNLHYSKLMLTLRRHEKDYLLRKDLKYREKFNEIITSFKDLLKNDKNNDSKIISTYLTTYQEIFHKLIDKDIIIGLHEDRGLMKRIDQNINQIEKNLAEIHTIIYSSTKRKISQAVITLFVIITLLSSAILIILYRDSRYIVSSIKRLRKYITRLGKGELPEVITIKGSDEIADMKHSINILTENLKRTRDFVIEVGNGQFTSEINVFNGEGELGSNLLAMRKKLLQVASEREQQQIEAERRIWNNEGIGLFAEVLRNNSDNLEELSFQIIKNLVKYLKANQGGLFIRNEEQNNETFFDLKAAFAYDRRKFADKKVKLGEGVLGMCALEGETVYMTDIPHNYIEITSGLGGANPSSLIIIPIKQERKVLGIIEIASFKKFESFEIEFIEKIAANIASHLYFVQMNIKTNMLLEETQRQAEEMKAQEEEMRQNMEELQVTQERLATREEELLFEISNLKIRNKELFQELTEIKENNEFKYDSIEKYN